MTGFISDIHGNAAALLAVLRRLDELGAKRIYSLGDIAGYYPGINRCAEMLRERDIPHILGNHDAYLLGGLSCERSSTAGAAIEYQRGVISKGNLDWLRSCGTFFSEPSFFAVHGGVHDYLDEYAPDFQFPEGIPQRLFFTGHTHVQAVWSHPPLTHCNPGSVGQPRDGDSRAAFAVTKAGTPVLMRVAYDIDATAAAARDAGFPERLFSGLYTGRRIGAGGARPADTPRREKEEGLC